MRLVHVVAVAAALGLPLSAAAGPTVLVIGNERHDRLATVAGARGAVAAGQALQRQGFALVSGSDLRSDQMRSLLGQFWTALDPFAEDEVGPVVILLAGHFVSAGDRVWLLGREAQSPGLAGVDAVGLSVDTVLQIAALAPGGAVVALARSDAALAAGPGLVPGVRTLDIPQGVTVIQGPVRAVTEAVRSGLARPDTSLAEVARLFPDVRVEGFVTPRIGLVGAGAPAVDPETARLAADRAAWETAAAAGTEAAYQGYLAQYPAGLFAPQARAEIARLQSTPEAVEAALGLTAAQRRTIQQNLTLLGYSTRGVDGIFGPGTRTAIGNWQRGNGLAGTGFLNGDQIALLAAQAQRRAEEEAAAERARQEELARQDRAFWQATGAAGDEAGLRAYLDRYPQGEFAAIARERLAIITAQQDRAAWDEARALDTADAYRRYLQRFPTGAFADRAEARIAELEPREDPAIARAREEERSLRLGPLTRLLIEQRLSAEGFGVGRVDGEFDDDTRAGIADFQVAIGARETGYLTERQVQQLLPNPLLRLLD